MMLYVCVICAHIQMRYKQLGLTACLCRMDVYMNEEQAAWNADWPSLYVCICHLGAYTNEAQAAWSECVIVVKAIMHMCPMFNNNQWCVCV